MFKVHESNNFLDMLDNLLMRAETIFFLDNYF